MNTTLTVFIKELRDSARDRRTIINALLIGPLLGPLLLGVIFTVMTKAVKENNERPYTIAIVHPEFAPNLMRQLKQSGMDTVPVATEEKLQASVAAKQQAVGLIVPEYFAKRLESGETAELKMVYDSSRDTIDTGQQRLERAIHAYSDELGALRLVMRGIAPEVARPIVIATRDLATPSSRAGQILRSLPYFLILSTFLGGMFLAIDSTAGERERQSLEPLFTLPVARGRLLAGKLLAVMACATASMLLSMLAIVVMTKLLPLNLIGLTVEVNSVFAAQALLTMLPLIFFIASLELLVASYARTFRQAQSYMGFMQLIIILPGAMIMSLPFNMPAWIYAIPVVSQQMSLVKYIGGSYPPVMFTILGTLITLAIGGLAFYLCVRLFKGEQLAVSS
jgi:sodium transport system permease protein